MVFFPLEAPIDDLQDSGCVYVVPFVINPSILVRSKGLRVPQVVGSLTSNFSLKENT